jgi:hypothetical protein
VIALRQRFRESRTLGLEQVGEAFGGRSIEQRWLTLAILEKALELRPNRWVAGTPFGDELAASLRASVEQGVDAR